MPTLPRGPHSPERPLSSEHSVRGQGMPQTGIPCLLLYHVPSETWLAVVERRVPPKYVELNREAFWEGRLAIDGG